MNMFTLIATIITHNKTEPQSRFIIFFKEAHPFCQTSYLKKTLSENETSYSYHIVSGKDGPHKTKQGK